MYALIAGHQAHCRIDGRERLHGISLVAGKFSPRRKARQAFFGLAIQSLLKEVQSVVMCPRALIQFVLIVRRCPADRLYDHALALLSRGFESQPETCLPRFSAWRKFTCNKRNTVKLSRHRFGSALGARNQSVHFVRGQLLARLGRREAAQAEFNLAQK